MATRRSNSKKNLAKRPQAQQTMPSINLYKQVAEGEGMVPASPGFFRSTFFWQILVIHPRFFRITVGALKLCLQASIDISLGKKASKLQKFKASETELHNHKRRGGDSKGDGQKNMGQGPSLRVAPPRPRWTSAGSPAALPGAAPRRAAAVSGPGCWPQGRGGGPGSIHRCIRA